MCHSYLGQQEKQEYHSVATGKVHIQEKREKAILSTLCTCSPLTYFMFSIYSMLFTIGNLLSKGMKAGSRKIPALLNLLWE
jgi:hypothetical protein